MKKSNQSGFAAVEAFLVVIILGIVGFTGWYVWHSKQATDKTLNNAAKSAPATAQAKKVASFADCKKAAGSKTLTTSPEQCVTKDGKTFTDTNASTSSAQQYLTIKEWGVKLPVSGDISDAYYLYKSDIDVVYLSKAAYKDTNCAADSTTLGAIDRFTASTKDELSGNNMLSERPNAIHIGNYYFAYQHPQAACDGSPTNDFKNFDSAKAQTSSAQMNEFSAAVSKLVAAE